MRDLYVFRNCTRDDVTVCRDGEQVLTLSRPEAEQIVNEIVNLMTLPAVLPHQETAPLTFQLTRREAAIVAAMMRCCTGWTSAQELQRFVNVGAEHVNDGWTDEEMEAVSEKFCGQFQGSR